MASDEEWQAGDEEEGTDPVLDEHDPDPAEISEEEEYAPKKSAKRQKKQPIKRSKKQGRLSQLLSLPIDVSHAILSYLDPVDVMNMSR